MPDWKSAIRQYLEKTQAAVDAGCGTTGPSLGRSVDADEPFLREDRTNGRFLTVPRKYPDLEALYDEIAQSHWHVGEIDLKDDYADFQRLDAAEQWMLLMIHMFFAVADGIVMENLVLRFSREVMVPVARIFYGLQLGQEGIHADMYSRILETIYPAVEELQEKLADTERHPSLVGKQVWAKRWIDNDDQPFAVRLFAFAIVEGVFFQGSFAAIYRLKKIGKCSGIDAANGYIARDEGLHCRFACALLRHFVHRPSVQQMHHILAEAVAIELRFWDEALPEPILGMSREAMQCYICYVADQLLALCDAPLLYHVPECPLDHMIALSLKTKDNFFEQKRSSEYARARHGGSSSDNHFAADVDNVDF